MPLCQKLCSIFVIWCAEVFFFNVASSHGRSLLLLGFFIVQTCYYELGDFSFGWFANLIFSPHSSSDGVNHLIRLHFIRTISFFVYASRCIHRYILPAFDSQLLACLRPRRQIYLLRRLFHTEQLGALCLTDRRNYR